MYANTSDDNFRDDATFELLAAADPARRGTSDCSTFATEDDNPLGDDYIGGWVGRYVLERLEVQAVVLLRR
jgi:hypothetical protein